MGRDKKLGNEICPIHQSLGYYRPHNRRNTKSESIRYTEHYTFATKTAQLRSTMSVIRACRVHYTKDNLKKTEPSEIEAIERMRYAFQRIEERFKTFPHNEDDTKRLTSAVFSFAKRLDELKAIRFIYHMKWKFDSSNQPMPEVLQRLWNLVVQLEKSQKQETQLVNRLMQEEPEEYDRYLENLIRSNPLLVETHRIMEKNLGQEQADKFMKRNKLLSESHFGSEKYNRNYNGIPQSVHRQKVTRN